MLLPEIYQCPFADYMHEYNIYSIQKKVKKFILKIYLEITYKNRRGKQVAIPTGWGLALPIRKPRDLCGVKGVSLVVRSGTKTLNLTLKTSGNLFIIW